MSSRVLNLFVACCVSLSAALPTRAAEIRGEIGAVDDKGVAVLISGGFEPQPGDKFAVLVEVPGVGEASIAQGQVETIDDGIVIGKIVAATGKVAVGQKVKIDSPQAVRKRPAPAAAEAILGKIGAVVDKDITIVTTSKVDPAIGDKVEVFVEVPNVGPASVGVGKVTAVEGGLITARIEQATGKLAFGQQVLISLSNPPPVAAGSPVGSAPGGEVLGLKLDPVDAAVAELLDLPKAAGLVVRSVTPGSPADTAGLKKRDVLLRAGGAELNDLEKFRAATAKGSGELKVEIWRNGAAQTIMLALPAPSASGSVSNPASSPASTVWIGLGIETMRDDVRVNTIIPGSPGARAGFRFGDRLKMLDGEDVVDATLFIRAVSSGAAGKARRIEVARGDERLTFELLPEPKPTNEQLFARMKKLAEAGDHDAEFQLALMYETGQGIPDRDAVAARRWMRAAAEANVPLAQWNYGAYLIDGLGGEKNPTAGVEWIKKAAEQHVPSAALSLGQIYRLGRGVEKHEAEARHWYARALKLGSLPTLVTMGQLYEFGVLYEKDLPKAAEFYRTAAHRGSPSAQAEWGRCLLHGIGVEQDQQAALRWVTTASDAGDPLAHEILGEMYFQGQGVAQDHEAGVKLFRKAATAGQVTALFNLGGAYLDGRGVQKDLAESFRWFHAAADRGNVGAYVLLGQMYERGHGVTQSDEQAVAWYRKSAEAGIAEGQYDLGVMYSNGRGVAKSDAEALKWCHKAALQKHPAAEWYMGMIALDGRGVSKDATTAYAWFNAGAKHGNAQAQYYLGTLYETGNGVAGNQSEAIKLYEQAAGQGDQTAINALKRLGKR